MPGMMSIGGLASGIKTDEIISKYMEYARRPQKRLEFEKEKAQQRLAAWQDLNTRVLALQTKSEAISSTATFQTKKATSSMEDVVKATSSADAVAGTYYLNVTKSAKSHQIASQNYAGLDSPISEGTIRITVGSKPVDVKIDSTNNTLLGVKDAINKANAGVRASVINEGTAGSPSYSLVITSNNTGTDNRMIVDAGDTGLLIGCDQHGEGTRREVQAAEDAEIKMGSLTFARSSNTITDIIPGVTLNIANPDPARTVKIEITRDTDAAKNAVKGFVDQFNDIMKTIKDMTVYDPSTGETGIFLGNYQVQSLQMDLESVVTGSVSGIPTEKGKQTYNALSTIGVTLGLNGLLVINDADLSAALEKNPAEVGKLFGTTLDADSPYISLVSTTADTRSSGVKGYDINITRAATRATITAGAPMAETLAQAETLTINGKTVSLESGWNRERVIAEINKYSKDTNVSAYETIVDGQSYLTLRTLQYGSGRDFTAVSNVSSINQAGGTGLGSVKVSLNSYAGENGLGSRVEGLDVAGTINGENAVGKGQVLTAEPSNPKSVIKGLQIIATNTGPLETKARLIKGVGTSIKEMLTTMTASKGLFTNTQSALDSEISAITKDMEAMEDRLLMQQDRLYSDFNRMETQMAKLTQQGNYLSAQLTAMTKSK